MKKISFSISCYKSENTISSVIEEIINECRSLGYEYEIICINDNSPDNLLDVLKDVCIRDKQIKLISFSKNFGQHAGMIAGAKYAKGDILVYLDDDGQCPIDHLKELIEPIEKGYDISIAKYGKKKQSIFKNLGSELNEYVANILLDKPREIQMGNFMAISRIVIDEVKKYTGPYPYISGLLFRTSSKVINVPMEERCRIVGRTTYSFRKLVSLWINGFTAFSIKPLRFASIVGSICALGGFIYAMVIIISKIINPKILIGWSSLMAILLFIGGIIIFVLGLIGEYIGRIYMSINGMPQSVINETENIYE